MGSWASCCRWCCRDSPPPVNIESVEVDGKPVPGLAPAAKQQGAYVAERIRSLVAAKATDANKKIVSRIVGGRHSKFLSTDFIF